MPTALDDAISELDNWARWGRQQDGPRGYGEPSIWDAWLSFKDHIAGWGLTAAEKEAEARGMVVVQGDDWQPPIDEQAAEITNRHMIYLHARDARSYALLRRHFYKQQRQSDEDLYPALRQYCDLTVGHVPPRPLPPRPP